MSNNGSLSNASNGRNSANTKSISHKNDTKSPQANSTNIKTNATTITISTTTSNINTINNALPERTTNTKTIHNDTKHTIGGSNSSSSGSGSCSNNHSMTHRRDNSSSIATTPATAATQKRTEARQYQYIKPQTLPVQQTRQRQTQQQQQQANEQHSPSKLEERSSDEAEQQLLVYCDGHIMSGTLEALVQHMVPTCEYYPERTFIFAFLLSGRLFVRPHELLSQIGEMWEQQQQQILSKDVVDDAPSHVPSISVALPPAQPIVAASASPLTQRKKGVMAAPILNDATALTSLEGTRLQRTNIQLSAQNCIRLLADWIDTFPYDFRDERLMQQVRILARKCVYIDNSLGKQVSRILQLLVQRLTALEKYEEFLQTLIATDLNSSQHQHYSTSAAAAFASSNAHDTNHHYLHHHQHNDAQPKVTQANAATAAVAAATSIHASNPANVNAAHSTTPGESSHDIAPLDIIDMCASCAQLAHQLTAIELERLSHIGPEEFVQAFAKEYQTTAKSGQSSRTHVMNSSSLNDMKKTRNLESYVEWFNRLSYLTASEIVKYPKKKQRVRVIEYWIETARECFNIGNFNSLMAIIAGLNLAPIARLKKTWSKVQSAKFSVLEHQMDPTSNFNSYRSTLKAAMWRSEGATDERERIIIPFFSLFVKDLYFLNESCSNRLPNNHINFEKCSQLAKQVMEFNEWKKVNCPFEKLANVIAFLQNSPILNENTLSMASFECEPPENNEEKGRYKTVKAETKQQLLQQLQEQQQ